MIEKETTPVTSVPASVEVSMAPNAESGFVEAVQKQGTDAVVEPVKPAAKPDPNAELKAARESGRLVKAKVTELVQKNEGDKHVVGARVELDGFKKGKRAPFMPKSHFGFPPQRIAKDTVVQVCILPEDAAKPGVTVSRKLALEAYLGTLEANETVVVGTVAGVSSKGSIFVELDNLFEALLPERGTRYGLQLKVGDPVEALVVAVDVEKMSVVLSDYWASALKLSGTTVKGEVVSDATRKSDGRVMGRNLRLETGHDAFLVGRDDQLPAVGEKDVKVKVEKVDPKERRLVVVLEEQPAGDKPTTGSGQTNPGSGSQGNAGSGNQGQGTSSDPGRGTARGKGKQDERGERGKRSEKGRQNSGGRQTSGGGFSGRSRFTPAREERGPSNWGANRGLREGHPVDGEIVALDSGVFNVRLARGVEATLCLSEVSDEPLADPSVLVGTKQKLVVISVDDEKQLVRVSLKRAVLAVKWLAKETMTGVCTGIVADGKERGARTVQITADAGKAQVKVNGLVRIDWRNYASVGQVQAGQSVEVSLYCVPNANPITFALAGGQLTSCKQA